MSIKMKNVKISDFHHEILKKHSEKNGFKIHKILEKLIDTLPKPTETVNKIIRKDIYGENQ